MEFGDFELFDDEEQAGPTQRQVRLEAARQASKNYKAKLDEPGWYQHVEATDATSRSSTAITVFQIHAAYLEGRYLEALHKSQHILSSYPSESADGAQMLDLIMRSAVKAGKASEVCSVADDSLKLASAHHGLAISAAQCFAASGRYADAVKAYLVYLSVRAGPAAFDQLCNTIEQWATHDSGRTEDLKKLSQCLRQVDAPIPDLNGLPLSVEAKQMLQDLINKRRVKSGQGHEEQVHDTIRSVNNL